MFLGSYDHSLDEKGRVVIPSKFREPLENGCVVTKGEDGCLYIFTEARFSEEASQIARRPRQDKRIRSISRAMFSEASLASLDSAGRLQLPEPLRRYAQLENTVKVNGVFDRIEIWAPQLWDAESATVDEYYSGIEEALWEAKDA